MTRSRRIRPCAARYGSVDEKCWRKSSGVVFSTRRKARRIVSAARACSTAATGTHWQWAIRSARTSPNVRLDSDRIFIRDAKVSTSAGITAGMDLALSIV